MTRDLWLQSLNNKPLLENVFTGETLQVEPEQLPEALKVYRGRHETTAEKPLLRAVDRVLREWSVETGPTPLERFTVCRKHCFEKAVLEGDSDRDLEGVFNTAAAFFAAPDGSGSNPI